MSSSLPFHLAQCLWQKFESLRQGNPIHHHPSCFRNARQRDVGCSCTNSMVLLTRSREQQNTQAIRKAGSAVNYKKSSRRKKKKNHSSSLQALLFEVKEHFSLKHRDKYRLIVSNVHLTIFLFAVKWEQIWVFLNDRSKIQPDRGKHTVVSCLTSQLPHSPQRITYRSLLSLPS